MKNPILLAISASLLAGTALAGSPETLVYQAPPQVVATAAATNWSGFYAGGMVSFDTGSDVILYDFGSPLGADPLSSIIALGGFVGYNFQRGSMVFGGEFAASSGGIRIEGDTTSGYDAIFDLKVRLGFSIGKALPYLVMGHSFSNFDRYGADNFPGSGLSYGAGMDFALNEHLFVGAEYLVRDLSGAWSTDPNWTNSATIQSAQLRVGWKF